MSIKINLDKLNEINSIPDNDIKSNFGNWTDNIDQLKNNYINAQPFEYCIIDNFLNAELANEISELFPQNLDEWHRYNNPLEVKYAYDNINNLDEKIQKVFYMLCSSFVENIFSQITNNKLEYDPYLHGSGLHMMPRNGRLATHLDYEIHPISGKERKLNIILYLSKNWDTNWNGDTELWNFDATKCLLKSPVIFNTAIIFKTNDISFHGVSEKITCPENVFRKSLAFYYVSNSENNNENNNETKFGDNGFGIRTKASFVCRPDEKNKDKLIPLLNIRPIRRIEKSDLDKFWPEWNYEDY